MPPNPRAQRPDALLELLSRIFRARPCRFLVDGAAQRREARKGEDCICNSRDEGFERDPGGAGGDWDLAVLDEAEGFVKGVDGGATLFNLAEKSVEDEGVVLGRDVEVAEDVDGCGANL
ncbi:hypothetical protein HG531_011239 [Fusarium graminearum]|nr:hypothetical protein HG531_011239 [Fusarium graminearum]